MARDIVDTPPPEPPTKEEVAEQVLTGALGDRYRALGGKKWGHPVSFPHPLHGGGSYVYFTKNPTARPPVTFAAIYAHPSTGAWEIYGAIHEAWVAAGRTEGPLGFPTSGELPTHDPVGRFQRFQNGMYVWHSETGAHPVEGVLLPAYERVGGSVYGYPIAGGAAKDGGRYAHVRKLPEGWERSIYWHPSTGAVEVFGDIRERYRQVGWEHSHLGYPVAPEEPWSTPGDNGGSRQQRFQGGRIMWRDSDGATFVDPVELVGSVPGGAGFGGEARVRLHSDGTVVWSGEVTNSAYQDYDYRIYAVVEAPAEASRPPLALALAKTGEINMQVIGTNKNRWSETTTNPAVTDNYAQLATATIQVHSQFSGGITSKLDDIVTTIGAWTFTAAVGPIGLGLIYAGVELGSLVTGGNVPAGPRILAGTMWMHGPGGMLFGFVIDELTKIGQRRRGLTNAEIQLLDIVFAGSIDPRQITITDTKGKGGRPFAFPGAGPAPAFELNMGDHYRDAHEVDFVRDNLDDNGNVTNATSYILHGIFDSEYTPKGFDTPWSKQNIEQQASVVEDWVQRHFRPEDTSDAQLGLMSAAARVDTAFDYAIGNIRAGRT